jgi:23S rRNA pseudouridine1911/1915/1917 synthase
MESMGHPIVGDDLYNHYKGFKKSKTGLLSEATRQMLHSAFLEIIHPTHHERMSFSAPMYPDMSDLIARLESAANNSESR